jgi:hypothetical protein
MSIYVGDADSQVLIYDDGDDDGDDDSDVVDGDGDKIMVFVNL